MVMQMIKPSVLGNGINGIDDPGKPPEEGQQTADPELHLHYKRSTITTFIPINPLLRTEILQLMINRTDEGTVQSPNLSNSVPQFDWTLPCTPCAEEGLTSLPGNRT